MPTPESDDYRLLVTSSWSDIHYARGQDWRALLVVAGVHVGVLQALHTAKDMAFPFSFPWLTASAGVLAFVFVVIGILVTCRHYRLMRIKLGWIYLAESRLGLVKAEENTDGIIPPEFKMEDQVPWKGLRWPRAFSASWLIICFYFLLALVDVAAVILALSS
jgi:hypothetical protein